MPGIDSFTKLLLHCDGIDGSTTFTDETGKTVTPNGSVQIDTAQYKFGGASGLFNGLTDYLSVADSEDWNFGTDAFTIDFRVRFNSVSVSQYFVSQYDLADGKWLLGFNFPSNNLELWNGVNLDFTCPFTPSTGIWYHIAFVRIDNGNTSASWRIFVNSISQTLTKAGGNWSDTMPNTGTDLQIGAYAGSVLLDGWIDEFRISKGIARWSSDFPIPEYAYNNLLPFAKVVII